MNLENLTIIGEKINYSIPSIKRLLDSKDFQSIQEIALTQSLAPYLEVNIGITSNETLIEVIKKIQEVTQTPLCIDDPDPVRQRLALDIYDFNKSNGLPILNSATESRAEEVLSLRREKECQVILLVSERGTSKLQPNKTIEEAYETTKRLFERAINYGFSPNQIFIDPGLPAIASDLEGLVNINLDLIEKVNSDMKVHTLVGLSNISYGLPKKLRLPIQNAFLTLALERGLDTIIGNPNRSYEILTEDNPYLIGFKKILDSKEFDRLITLKKLY